ncbi:MAG: hypothetical protein C0605_10605 [Hyphomicrobiales bacterium]|nr:MAG: hypothetical protein C0605_10605 [Hyphomicrobiales bacterium]
MMDDFFVRAMVAGIGVAIIAGPLGCFIVWRRMAYFGETIAHSALLGVSFGLLLDTHTGLTVFATAAAIALFLLLLQRSSRHSSDALLGILSHATLALGLVMIGFMTWIRVDLIGYLFGDILAVSTGDIAIIYGGGAAVLAVLVAIWRPLLAETASFDLAEVEGLRPHLARLIFMLMIAAVIAIAMKIVGILLITALLVIPAVTARRFAASPEMMAVAAALIGIAAVAGGMGASLRLDTPAGPSIVTAAFLLFLLSQWPGLKRPGSRM